MANVPDLMSLLCLDAKFSSSPFGGQHRTILISKDFSNSGDFVISNLLQHFSRKEPNTPILLVTMCHDWSNYSARAAKCGFNLRRTQNGGMIEVINLMSEYLSAIKKDSLISLEPCRIISDSVIKFIKTHASEPHSENSGARMVKPLIIIIDDLSMLLTIGAKPNEIYRLFSSIDKSLRDRSKELQSNFLSHFVVQTMATSPNPKQNLAKSCANNDLDYLISNLENLCDLTLILKPLITGYSTRVDGTITIIDNRLALPNKQAEIATPSLFAGSSFSLGNKVDVGVKKAFFFKLSDRRIRLTSSALIF